MACVLLKSEDHPEHRLFENHVTSNAFSLAQAKVEPEWRPRAIYLEDTIVGFAMYGVDRAHSFHFVTRLMIDRYQRNGYGRRALTLVLGEIAAPRADEVFTSIVPGNEVAAALYASLGFAPTSSVIEFGNESEPLFRKAPK